MKLICPNCCASREDIRKDGSFFRKSDSRKIRRYRCKRCGKSFSNATFSQNFNQKKRRVNFAIKQLLAASTSMRRTAIILNINRKTVARKLKILAQQSRRNNEDYLKDKVFSEIQFDDLETIEHTKLKPVTVTLFVGEDRKIIGFDVARIRAKGHLAKLSVKKYGLRANEAPLMRERLFARLKPHIATHALIESDEHPSYPDLVKRHFPKARHETFLSKRSCTGGQGELKRVEFDPLFKINHTFAMLRANVARLVRRTWNTTKSIECLRDHLDIYMDYHNQQLT